MHDNWPPTDPVLEEWIELEYMLKHCIQDIKTNIRLRRSGVNEYGLPKESDLFLGTIREKWELKWKLRRQLFVLRLKHGDPWT